MKNSTKTTATKTFKAYLIDTELLTITAIDISSGLDDMYKAIGCNLVQIAHIFANGDTIWVDEEGLLKRPTSFAAVQGAYQPFAGKAIVTGSRGDHNQARSNVTFTREQLLDRIAFIGLDEVLRNYA